MGRLRVFTRLVEEQLRSEEDFSKLSAGRWPWLVKLLDSATEPLERLLTNSPATKHPIASLKPEFLSHYRHEISEALACLTVRRTAELPSRPMPQWAGPPTPMRDRISRLFGALHFVLRARRQLESWEFYLSAEFDDSLPISQVEEPSGSTPNNSASILLAKSRADLSRAVQLRGADHFDLALHLVFALYFAAVMYPPLFSSSSHRESVTLVGEVLRLMPHGRANVQAHRLYYCLRDLTPTQFAHDAVSSSKSGD